MKFKAYSLAALVSVVTVGACEMTVLDNYDQPTSTLTGRVEFQGRPVGVRSNAVQLELWQPGYALRQKIPVYVAQDGSFSAVVFDGTYKLNLLPGNGPWLDTRDTIQIEVRREAAVTVPVTPFYTVNNESVRHANGNIEATFQIGQVNTSRALEYVGLYVSTTSFVDRTVPVRVEVARSAIASLNAPVNVTLSLPANLRQRRDVHARIGVKTVGVAEMLFSPVVKIDL